MPDTQIHGQTTERALSVPISHVYAMRQIWPKKAYVSVQFTDCSECTCLLECHGDAEVACSYSLHQWHSNNMCRGTNLSDVFQAKLTKVDCRRTL